MKGSAFLDDFNCTTYVIVKQTLKKKKRNRQAKSLNLRPIWGWHGQSSFVSDFHTTVFQYFVEYILISDSS